MKQVLIKTMAVTALLFTTSDVFSQYTFYKPTAGFGIEISLSNTTLKRMPVYRNAVASLTVTGDHIIGGTAAGEKLDPYIFVASLSKREMVQMKDISTVIKGQRSIRSGFFKTGSNQLYAGTMAQQNSDGTNGSGHLIQVNVSAEGNINVTDLGVPVTGEGVFALCGNDHTGMLYGITYPSGIFFSYDLKAGKTKTYNNTVPTKEALETLTNEFHKKPEDFLCSSLIVDAKGMVYGSQPINKVFCFNPADESFRVLSDLPEVWGRHVLGRVESWTKSADGMLYGGNAGDGQLFSLDPATGKVKNLGKPIMMNRLRGLSFAADGKLYGIAGAAPGYAHLFSYDPAGVGYTDMGNPQFILKAPGIEQGIEWRGFQLGTITTSEDGKYVVMGEDEALSQLLVFPVDN
ncbi:hypothetical protein [Chitinophaga sp. MM2321]|uniref:hypothetical protein n=1 Tax=Chitinophaga sp. MM2321 TaxID=3137178 RepID=UPI0032D59027